uniref:Uncharacterized protein n=1 Tax=Rhizophora mucronata TaxID=61149 RepID=A0A2P2JIX8_RHIMU
MNAKSFTSCLIVCIKILLVTCSLVSFVLILYALSMRLTFIRGKKKLHC